MSDNPEVHFTVVEKTVEAGTRSRDKDHNAIVVGILCHLRSNYYASDPLISTTDMAGLAAAADYLNNYVNDKIADARRDGAREAISNLTAEIVGRVEKGGAA